MHDPIDALYARQSIDKKDSISIENQIAFCQYETRGNDYETYIDRGFSGKNTNRPAFSRMMEDIRAGKVKRVIVYKLDRISRSILDFATMMEIFQEYHVEFVSSTEKFDTSTPIGNAMLNISIVFAQLERETIQKRVADAYHTKSQKGYYMGGRVPYGFRLEPLIIHGIHTSRFTPETSEMQHIQLIYTLYAQPDTTLADVLRELLNRGITQKRETPWCTARISEIISNPVYAKADVDIYNFFSEQGANIINPISDFIGVHGIFLYQGCDGNTKKRKQSDLKGRDVVLAPHKGVIDSDVWLKCRLKLMHNRQSARTNKGKRSWLSGKIKCKKCGYAYTITKSNTRAGRYFQCSGGRYSIKCKGAGHTIYADVLEDYIAKEIQKELKYFSSLSNPQNRPAPQSDNPNKIRIAEIDKEIQALLSKLIDANKTLTDYINMRIEILDQEKQYLEKKLMQIIPDKTAPSHNTIADPASKWPELSPEDKQRIADLMIYVIYIDEDMIEIQWNL